MTVNEELSALKAAVEELESKYCENCQEWDCDYCRAEADSAERRPMADLIDRQAAIDALWGLDVELRPSAIDAILNRLKDLPSAQLDNIVCGDCKYWICHDRRCGYWNHGVKPLEWCCHAERREG